MKSALDSTSTRPYLVRALYEWCTDNGLTPYVAVQVDNRVQVPREFVQNGEIVLNISFDATSGLKLGNEFIEFKARFGGVPRDILVPMDRVIAIYARENGQGMAFPVSAPVEPDEDSDQAEAQDTEPSATADVPPRGIQLVPLSEHEAEESTEPEPPTPPVPGKRKPPALKRIK